MFFVKKRMREQSRKCLPVCVVQQVNIWSTVSCTVHVKLPNMVLHVATVYLKKIKTESKNRKQKQENKNKKH